MALASLSGFGIIYGIGVLYMYLIQSLYFCDGCIPDVIVKGMSLFFLKDLLLFLAASVLAMRLIPLLRRSQAK